MMDSVRQSYEFETVPAEEAGLIQGPQMHNQRTWCSGLGQIFATNGLSAKPSSKRPRLWRSLRRLGEFTLAIFVLLGLLQLVTILHGAYIAYFPQQANKVVTDWPQVGKSGEGLKHWATDFTRDVMPIPCHSHNDYWRLVPLYSGVSAGCVSTEADVWLINGQLHVGHDLASLTENRTLDSLYVQPLVDILTKQNPMTKFVDSNQSMNGVFDTDTEQVFTLLIDLKTEGQSTFDAVVNALRPLRAKSYLTSFDGEKVVERPLRIIGTGNTPFESVLSQTKNPYKDIFFDSPLGQMFEEPDKSRLLYRGEATTEFSPTNSYYASDDFAAVVGRMWGWSLTSAQMHRLRGQIKEAHARGLKVRYWNTPAWPVSRRNKLWKILLEEGADVLNVDDLQGAAHEDWSGAWRWWT